MNIHVNRDARRRSVLAMRSTPLATHSLLAAPAGRPSVAEPPDALAVAVNESIESTRIRLNALDHNLSALVLVAVHPVYNSDCYMANLAPDAVIMSCKNKGSFPASFACLLYTRIMLWMRR